MAEAPWLSCLNSSQRKAVERPSDASLQILAGPGSGKTRVLTCRVAYLLRQCEIPPKNLVAVTFTNKAANEMKNRLVTLLGGQIVSKVVLGTFHGMCVGFLRKHGTKVGLQGNWSICDRDQQIQYCKKVLKDPRFADSITENNLSIKPNVLIESISRAKCHGNSPEKLLQQAESPYHELLALMFRAYTDLLTADNCLDFDDLLLLGEQLFRIHPSVIAHIQHVLIDEFQDTNMVQYQIMSLLAHRGAVTVVGDPDQGIYGFRHAQSINLVNMTKDFPKTQIVLLEENYRSSSAILKAALAVVQQDQERIDKNLYTSHPQVTLPMLRPFLNPQEETAFIAQEIHRLIAHTGGQLDYNDISVLMRYNALSRNLETAFKTAGIPIRMIGAQKFFERTEVKDILSYLQLADNPNFTPAFERIINIPRRNIGLVTMDAIKAACVTHRLSPMEVLVQAARGKKFEGLRPSQVVTLKKFLGVICNIQRMAQEGFAVAQIIDSLLEQINYTEHLQKMYGPESVQRDANIQELKAYSTHLAGDSLSSSPEAILPKKGVPRSISSSGPRSDLAKSNKCYDQLLSLINQSPLDTQKPTPLRRFLIESSLATDSDAEDSKDETNKPRVTICTCHSSKGLEWPVVFVTAVEDGIFPFYLCNEPEEVKEERRLLFVAMTRAQGLLYLTYSSERMQGAETRTQQVSIFLKKLLNQQTDDRKPAIDSLISHNPPNLDDNMRRELSAVIGRPVAESNVIKEKVQEYHMKNPRPFEILSGHDRRPINLNQEFTQSNYNRWGQDCKAAAPLGRFSSLVNNSSSRGSFQVKSQGSISSSLGKFSSQSMGTSIQGTKIFKVSALHQPFVPPKSRKSIKEELTEDAKVQLPHSASSQTHSTDENQGLDRLQALSASFLSNLKSNIPADLPDSNSTKSTPSSSSAASDSKPDGKRSRANNCLSVKKKTKSEQD